MTQSLNVFPPARHQAIHRTTHQRHQGNGSFQCWRKPLVDVELVTAIGIDMDEAAIRSRLDACILTGQEFEKGPEKWSKFRDPLPEWDMSCDLDFEQEE